MPKKLPTITLPNTDDVEKLRQYVETELNNIIVQLNRDIQQFDLDITNHRIKNVGTPSQPGDAVNLSTLKRKLIELKKDVLVGLNRPRKPSNIPGPFRVFTARHFLNRPELPCAQAEPKIKVTVGLPTQVNPASGLVDEQLIHRNTNYVELFGENWDTLAVAVTDTSTGTMTVSNGAYFKANSLYRIDDEWIRIGTAGPTGNVVPIERAQEGSVAGTHTLGSPIRWAARILREQFSPDENGVQTVTPIIDNDERVSTRVFTGYSVNDEYQPGSTSTYTLTLAQPPTISDFNADPKYGEVHLTWGETTGSTYRYRIHRRVNGVLTWPFGTTYLYDEVPATFIGSHTYVDKILVPSDASYATTTYRYGVEAINILCVAGTGDTVGPLQGDTSPEQPAPDVTGISASEGADCQPDGAGFSEVTVSFTAPTSADWGSLKIYLLRPGDTNPTLVAEGEASPLKFRHQTTNETVTLYLVSVTPGGQQNTPILSQPNTTVLLDGATSAPVAVSNLWCQVVQDTLLVSWDNNVECNLSGYEVADVGGATPLNQASVTDAHVIAEVAASSPASGEVGGERRVRYEFVEPLYQGVSNGTVITMSGTGPYWPDNAVLVDGSGRNVHLMPTPGPAGTATQYADATPTGNNGTSITFAAGAIPTGTFNFFIRGTGGEHHFYVRAVNRAGLKSDWRPAPPTVMDCSPLGPDGTYDDGLPWIRPTFNPNPGSRLVIPGDGRIYCFFCAGGGDSPLYRRLQGIKKWYAYIYYQPSNDLAAGTDTATYVFNATPDATELFDTTPAGNGYIVETNIISDLQGKSIRRADFAVENFWGTSAFTEITKGATHWGGPTLDYHTGYIARQRNLYTEALSSAGNLSTHKGNYYINTLTLATTTIVNPTISEVGDEFTIILKQDATGSRQVSWDTQYFGPDNYTIDGTPNSYSVFKFKNIASGTNILIAEPVIGLT